MTAPWSPTAPLLITVAPTGAELDKQRWPQLPATLSELLIEAVAVEAAGAGMIHIHIRDNNGKPALDLPQLKETVSAVRERTGLVVQLSTGGSVTDPFEARLAVLDAAPDSCSLTCGTLNFGDDVFMNPWPFMADLYQKTQALGVVPEFEIFDIGQLASMERLLDTYGLPAGGKVHCDFVMGVPGGLPGNAQALATAVASLPDRVTSWSATGVGRAHLPVAAAAVALGGHLRVGMEDNMFFARNQPVESNVEFVQRAAKLSTLLQRPLMGPEGARALLGLEELRRL